MLFMKRLRFQSKFRAKIFLCFATLITIIIFILSVSLYKYMSDSMISETQNTMMQVGEKSMWQIDSMLQTMDSIAIQVACNPSIQKNFNALNVPDITQNNYFSQFPSVNSELNDILFSINSPLLLVKRISVFNKNGDFINAGILDEHASSANDFIRSEKIAALYSTFSQPSCYRIISAPHQDHWNEKNTEPIISVYRPVKSLQTHNVLAITEVQQSYSLFCKVLKNLPDMKAYVVNSDGELIYPIENIESIKTQDELFHFYEEKTRDKTTAFFQTENPISNEPELISCNHSSYSGWRLILVQSKNVLTSRLNSIGLMFFAACILLLLILFIVILILSNHLTKPLIQLKDVIQKTSLTRMNTQLSLQNSEDEITQLNTAFHEMLLRLKNSITYELNAQFCALQAQMNPHFLYNTIAVISAAAQETENQQIVHMCLALSDMLRYSSSFDDESVTLSSEIEYAQRYMELMKIRYEDYLSYEFKIEPAALSIKTPKFILQPLLENCFQHGFSCIEPPWHISIEIHATEAEWYIIVTDNGSGFQDDTILKITEKAEALYQNLQNEFLKTHIGSLGLSSIYARLKTIHKNHFIFQLGNTAPHGAKIMIGGKNHVEYHDR